MWGGALHMPTEQADRLAQQQQQYAASKDGLLSLPFHTESHYLHLLRACTTCVNGVWWRALLVLVADVPGKRVHSDHRSSKLSERRSTASTSSTTTTINDDADVRCLLRTEWVSSSACVCWFISSNFIPAMCMFSVPRLW